MVRNRNPQKPKRKKPKRPVTPTPPAPQLDPLWQRDLVVTVSLSSFSGLERDAAKHHLYGTVAVLLQNDAVAIGNQKELATISVGLRAAGWKIVGWAPTYAATDAVGAALMVDKFSLDGWIPNLEAWAEGPSRGLTSKWLGEFRSRKPDLPVLVSCLSSDTGNFARDFDYQACLDAGAGISPQVYTTNAPTYTVGAMEANLAKAGVPLSVVAPWFSIDHPSGLPFTETPVDEYEGWDGPHGIWTGDVMKVGTWPI